MAKINFPVGVKRADMTPEQRGAIRAYDKEWRLNKKANMSPKEKEEDRVKRRVHEKRCVESNRARKNANGRRFREKQRLLNPEAARLKEAARNQKRKQYIRSYERAHSKEPHKQAYVRLKGSIKRARTLRAMPPWVDKKRISEIYLEMVNLNKAGGDFVVDHIVPLANQRVCGLHIAQNLRILPRIENCIKSNRFIEELAIAPTPLNGLSRE